MRNNNPKAKLDLDKTKEKALNLLEYRAHSRKELYDKLIRFSDAGTVNEALDFLSENGIIDDVIFAYEYAHDAIELKYFGPRRIITELILKGIKKEDAERAVERAELECDSEEERLEFLLENKYRYTIKEKNGKQKVMSGLVRMGYGYETIKESLEKYDFEIEEDDYGL